MDGTPAYSNLRDLTRETEGALEGFALSSDKYKKVSVPRDFSTCVSLSTRFSQTSFLFLSPQTPFSTIFFRGTSPHGRAFGMLLVLRRDHSHL